MKERTLQEKIRRYLVQRGYFVIKLTTLGRYGSAGWPDLLVLGEAPSLWFIEVKSGTGKLTELQKRMQQSLRNRGYRVHTVYCWADFVEMGWS